MRRSRPNAFQVLLVCSWNVTRNSVHKEMHATAETCQAQTLSGLGSITTRYAQKNRVIRRFLWLWTDKCPGLSSRPTFTMTIQAHVRSVLNFCLTSSALSAMTVSSSPQCRCMLAPLVQISVPTGSSRLTVRMFCGTSTTTTTMVDCTWTSSSHCGSNLTDCYN